MKKLWGLTLSLGITGMPLYVSIAYASAPEMSGARSDAESEIYLSDQGSDDDKEERAVVESALSSSSESVNHSLQSLEKVRRLEQRHEHQSHEVKRQGELLIQLSERLKEVKRQEQLGRRQQLEGQAQLLQEVRRQLKVERQELEHRQDQEKEQARLEWQQWLEQQRQIEQRLQQLNTLQRQLERQQESSADTTVSLTGSLRALPNMLKTWIADHTLITGSAATALVVAALYYWYKKFRSGKREAKTCVDCESECIAL